VLIDDNPDLQAVADQFLLVGRQHLDGLTQALQRRSVGEGASPASSSRVRRGPHRSLPRVSRGGNPDSDPHTSRMRPQNRM
jgi:hypothetical protein